MWFTELFKNFQEELIDLHQDVFQNLIDNLDFSEQNVLTIAFSISRLFIILLLDSWSRKFWSCCACCQRRTRSTWEKLSRRWSRSSRTTKRSLHRRKWTRSSRSSAPASCQRKFSSSLPTSSTRFLTSFSCRTWSTRSLLRSLLAPSTSASGTSSRVNTRPNLWRAKRSCSTLCTALGATILYRHSLCASWPATTN